jgi:hypothetical protein
MFNRNKLTIIYLLLLQLAGSAMAFQTVSSSLATRKISTSTRQLVKADQDGDFPPEEDDEFKSSIDWDSEWKKVVANEGKLDGGEARPGQEFYKSEAEIAAIKATNKAAMKAQEVTSSVTDNIPQMSSFTGDWKFWIGILALVSVGLSLLSAPQNVPTGLSGDSYYI